MDSSSYWSLTLVENSLSKLWIPKLKTRVKLKAIVKTILVGVCYTKIKVRVFYTLGGGRVR